MAAKKKATARAAGGRRTPAIQFPEKLKERKVTARSLGKGDVQKAFLAAGAAFLIPDMMNAIRRCLSLDDMQAAKLTAELYGMAGRKDAGIVLNVNQQNNTTTDIRGRHGEGPTSFEQIAQVLEEEEKRRKAIPASFVPMGFEATPDSLIEGLEE